MPWLMFPAPSTATRSTKLVQSTRILRRPINSPATWVEARLRLRSIEKGRRDAKREFRSSPIVASPRVFKHCSHYSNDLVRVCQPPVVERFQAIGLKKLSHRYRRVLGSILPEYAGVPSECSVRESYRLLESIPWRRSQGGSRNKANFVIFIRRSVSVAGTRCNCLSPPGFSPPERRPLGTHIPDLPGYSTIRTCRTGGLRRPPPLPRRFERTRLNGRRRGGPTAGIGRGSEADRELGRRGPGAGCQTTSRRCAGWVARRGASRPGPSASSRSQQVRVGRRHGNSGPGW